MERQAPLRAVLLDFDGTLVVLPTDYDAMRAELKEFFRRHEIEPTSRSLLNSIEDAGSLMRRRETPADVVEQFLRDARAIVRRFELAAVPSVSIAAGASDFLGALKAAHLLVGVVTNNARETVEAVFARHRLPSPDVIVGLGDTKRFKPDAEPALAALRSLGAAPDETVLVGDNDRDRAMANAAGIPVVLVNPKKLTFPSLDDLRRSVRARP